jgi:hypothetical protein
LRLLLLGREHVDLDVVVTAADALERDRRHEGRLAVARRDRDEGRKRVVDCLEQLPLEGSDTHGTALADADRLDEGGLDPADGLLVLLGEVPAVPLGELDLTEMALRTGPAQNLVVWLLSARYRHGSDSNRAEPHTLAKCFSHREVWVKRTIRS